MNQEGFIMSLNNPSGAKIQYCCKDMSKHLKMNFKKDLGIC